MSSYLEDLKLFAKLLLGEIDEKQFSSHAMDNYQIDMILTKSSELRSIKDPELNNGIIEICNDILNIEDNDTIMKYINVFNFIEGKCKIIFFSKVNEKLNTYGYLIMFMLKFILALLLEKAIEEPYEIEENIEEL